MNESFCPQYKTYIRTAILNCSHFTLLSVLIMWWCVVRKEIKWQVWKFCMADVSNRSNIGHYIPSFEPCNKVNKESIFWTIYLDQNPQLLIVALQKWLWLDYFDHYCASKYIWQQIYDFYRETVTIYIASVDMCVQLHHIHFVVSN